LINWYARDRRQDESAPMFFARVEVAQVKQLLGDLERLAEQDATPADFIDLGEAGAFNPEVMEGECSA
jgi:hypothetical protein